jgi:hypothetical protein
VANLTQSRTPRRDTLSTVALPLAAQQVYKGGCAGYDTAALGSVKKAAALATFVPIGVFEEDMLNSGAAGSVSVLVRLQNEVQVTWFENAGNITLAANLFGVAYFTDDHTVSATVGTNGPGGRIWDVDPIKGVAVEFVGTSAVL